MVRVGLWAAYVVYLVTVGLLVWSTDPSVAGGAVRELAALLARLGLPVGERVVEFLLNVVMFVPLSLLGSFVLDRWEARWWLFAGLGATFLIELVQGMALPTRVASGSDLIANTTGAMVGLVAALLLRHLMRRRADRMAR